MTARPLVVSGVVLVLGLIGALLFARAGMRAPEADVQALAVFLSASGAGSLLIGVAIVHWVGGRLPSLLLRILLAYAFGILTMLVVIAATSILMFLNTHDLSLLLLLLGFSTAISMAFGYSVASALSNEIRA